MTCANLANAEVAQSKNDNLDDNIQVATPKFQAPTVQPKVNNQGSVSMTKAELAQHPDLIIRGMIPAVLQKMKKLYRYYYLYIEKFPKKIPSC